MTAAMDTDDLDSFITSTLESYRDRGVWEWNDETKSLQFISSIPGMKPKNCSKIRSTVSHLTVKPSQKPKLESVISLEDVKSVAVGLITSKTVVTMSFKATALFDRWYKAEELDYLLWCILIYYDDFLKVNGSVSSRGTSQSFLGSKRKDQTENEQRRKLGQGLANISQAYSYFLLNDIKSSELKTDEKRYASFRERLFSKHTDQMAFEVLYEFIMRVVWIAFGYTDWETIQNEIGRIFKTVAFIRVIPEEFRDPSEGEDYQSKSKSSPQSSSRCPVTASDMRPTISSVRTLRSPAISSLFPTPQEKSSHLLTRKPQDHSMEEKTFLPSLVSPPSCLGIIGDKLHKYDIKSLKLLHVEKKKLKKRGTTLLEDDRPLSVTTDQSMDRKGSAMSVTRDVVGTPSLLGINEE